MAWDVAEHQTQWNIEKYGKIPTGYLAQRLLGWLRWPFKAVCSVAQTWALLGFELTTLQLIAKAGQLSWLKFTLSISTSYTLERDVLKKCPECSLTLTSSVEFSLHSDAPYCLFFLKSHKPSYLLSSRFIRLSPVTYHYYCNIYVNKK